MARPLPLHALWCLFLDGKALPVGRCARLEEAIAGAVSYMKHEKYEG